MKDKPELTAMISSTAVDLPVHREAATNACLSMELRPIAMEYFPASNADAIAESLAKVDEADIYIGIYAHRYGTVPEGHAISITEMEFDRAVERGLPILVFLMGRGHLITADMKEDGEGAQANLKRFKEKASTGRVRKEFDSPEQLRTRIVESLHALLEDLALPVEAGVGPPPRLAHIHFAPLREKFAGRKALLDELAVRLQPGKAQALSQAAAVKADGGVGKTAVAVELAWRLFEEGKFDYVFLLNATSPESIDSDLAALCARDWLNLPEQEARESEVRLAGVLRWLRVPANAARTFLVLDGADAEEARAKVRALHPLLPGCALLVTSRGSIGGGIKEQRLDIFTREEAREFLRTHLNPAFLQGADADATLEGIAQEVDHLPLALEIVASYNNKTHQSPQEWLRDWHGTPSRTIVVPPGEDAQYPNSLSHVWDQSVARLSEMALFHLQALAWFAPRPFGFRLAGLRNLPQWIEVRDWFVELNEASLIQWSHETDEVSIHRVLQAVIRHHLDEEGMEVSKALAVMILNSTSPDPNWSASGWRLWENLAPHLRAVLSSVEGLGMEKDATRLLNDFGYWLFLRANYAEAERFISRSLEVEDRHLGEGHPDTTIRLNNLALVMLKTSRVAKAESLARRALEITEKYFGENHKEVATKLNSLAEILRTLGRLTEAEGFFRRALEINEANLGKDHPRVGTGLNNLGRLLMDAKRPNEAEPLMRRALEIDEKSLGKEHPDVARDLNNLALHLHATNRLTEAEPLMRRALEIFLRSQFRGGHELASSRVVSNNYRLLLDAMGWSQEQIEEQVEMLTEQCKQEVAKERQ
jgi:tetratricopeptide (TPR) repeat protein